MKRTTLALLVTAVFASPLALAASNTTTQPAPAAASGATDANTPAADAPASTQPPATGASTAPASGTTPGAAQGTPGTPSSPAGGAAMSDDDRQRMNQALGTGQAGPDRSQAQMRSMSAGDLKGKDIHNSQGEKIGEVDAVVTNTAGEHFIVIGSGGFLGMGKNRAALPAERFWLRDDHLVVVGVTEKDVEAMEDVRTGDDQPYKDAERDTMVELAVWQQG